MLELGLCYGHLLKFFSLWLMVHGFRKKNVFSKYYSTHEPQSPLPQKRSWSELKQIQYSALDVLLEE